MDYDEVGDRDAGLQAAPTGTQFPTGGQTADRFVGRAWSKKQATNRTNG